MQKAAPPERMNGREVDVDDAVAARSSARLSAGSGPP